MDKELRFFSKGAEGIILKTGVEAEKDQCIKAYYGPRDKEYAEKEWEILNLLYFNGVRVPRPIELCKVIVEPKHIRFRKFTRPNSPFGNYWVTIPIEDIIGERFAIKRQLIKGRRLGTFLFPHPKIKASIKGLHESIRKLEYVVHDRDQPNNYIATPEGVYIIDVGSISRIHWPWDEDWVKFHSPIVTAWENIRDYCMSGQSELF